MLMRSPHAVLALALVSACGPYATDGPGGDLAGLAAIRVEPASQSLIIDGDTPARASYRAIGIFAGGEERDITDEATFALTDPYLGSFSGAELTSKTDAGGVTTVRATAGNLVGSTPLTLVLRKRTRDPLSADLPPDPSGSFSGTDDPARAPTLVYPNNEVVVPPNLSSLEFHFFPGAANTLFELSFTNDVTDVLVYLRCSTPMAGGCIYTPDADVWRWLSTTNRGGQRLSWSVRATDDQGTGVGTSVASALSFARDNIEGAVYYWTTSDDSAIMRYDFGSSSEATAEKFIGTEMTEGRCVGCHALSRDGTKMVTASGGGSTAWVLLLEVGSQSPMVPYDSTPRSAFSSWSPDGDRYVGVFGGDPDLGFNLNLFDGTTGQLEGHIDVGGTQSSPADHPDWSPDGDRIVFARVGRRTESSLAKDIYRGAIEMVTRMGPESWSAPEVLVSAADLSNHYYPTFSPDGSLVAFNRSTCTDGFENDKCDAYDDPSARLYLMRAQAGAEPVEMARANAAGIADSPNAVIKSSFPKWSPFVFRRDEELGSKLMWITFSSNRSYGLRAPSDGASLLWMAAVDPDALDSGDPSFPAFALPFQDIGTSNHTAQWTSAAVSVE